MPRGAVTDAGFQRGTPPIDQVVAHVLFHRRPATGLAADGAPQPTWSVCGRGFRRMLDRRAGHLLFVQGAATGKPLDDAAVMVAAGKAHPWVDAGRILPQDVLHRTLALHEFFPVQHGQIAETKNAMLHREFVSRLLPGLSARVGRAVPAPGRSAAEQHESPRGRGIR